MFFILVNYLGWSGGYINIVSFSDVNWENSYFGLNSFWALLNNINTRFNSVPFLSYKMFLEHVEDFSNTVVFGLPKIINLSYEKTWNILEIVTLIVTILFQPILVVLQGSLLIVHVLWFALCILGGIFGAFSGYYNLPMSDMPDMDEFRSGAIVLSNVKSGFTPFVPLGV